MKLSEIEARAKAATLGPWRRQTAACDHADQNEHCAVKGGGALIVSCMDDAADAAFITAAREDVPALCATVRVLAAQVAKLEHLIEREGMISPTRPTLPVEIDHE